MFKMQIDDTFASRVTASLATPKAGVVRNVSFIASFQYIDQEELQQVVSDLQDGEITNADLVERYLTGLDEVVDENGTAVSFDVAKAFMKKSVALSNALGVAFVRGVAGAKEKNSKRSPAR